MLDAMIWYSPVILAFMVIGIALLVLVSLFKKDKKGYKHERTQ